MFLNMTNSEKIAIIDDESSITYNDLISKSIKLSSCFKKRSIVFCLCDNSIDAVIGYLASIQAKAVPLLLNKNISKESLNTLVEVYKPRFFWSSENEDIGIQVGQSGKFKLIETYNPVYKINNQLEILLTTSGSTGSPKLVRHKKGNLESNALNVSLAYGWDNREIGLLDLPISYTMGLNVLNVHLFLQSTVVLTNVSPISPLFWKYIEKYHVTNLTGVPFSFELMDKLKFTEKNYNSITSLCQGGGKLSKELFEKIAKYCKENNINFFPSYGATETSARMTLLNMKKEDNEISIGKAMPLGITSLKNEKNNIGELVYRGPNVAMGYARKSDDLLVGDLWQGKYETGDIVERDPKGNFHIVGRVKRFLKLSGHRVSLDETENLLNNQFNITSVCVGTDKLMKIFIFKDNLKVSPKQVNEFISKKLNLFHTLFEVEVINEIKRKDNGKIDYSYYNNS